MIEEKIGRILSAKRMLGGVAAAAVMLLSSCGKDSCLEPAYSIKSAAELQAAENAYVLGSDGQTGNYLTVTCPSGCSYDSEVGCCWCPD